MLHGTGSCCKAQTEYAQCLSEYISLTGYLEQAHPAHAQLHQVPEAVTRVLPLVAKQQWAAPSTLPIVPGAEAMIGY